MLNARATNENYGGTRTRRSALVEAARALDLQIDEQRSEVSRLKAEALAIERQIAQVEADICRLVAARENLGPEADDDSPMARKRAPSSAAAVRGWVAKELRRRKSPMKRDEILKGLSAAGVQIAGNDPGRRINRILARSGAFQSTPKGYWFKDEPPPT